MFESETLGPVRATPWYYPDSAIDLDLAGGRYWNGSSANNLVTDFLSGSRGSIGYHRTAGGILQQFPSNTLRITDLGLLNENTRTNLALRSQEFDNAEWLKFAVVGAVPVVTANQINAPDGTLTADKLANASSGTNTYPLLKGNSTSGISITNGNYYSFTAYCKYGSGGPWVFLELSDYSANAAGAFFNIQTGTVGSSIVAGSGSIAKKEIEILANGWYRVEVQIQFSSGSPTVYANISSSLLADGAPLLAADNDFYYVWGAQLEDSTNYGDATSYIPTTTTSATRAADTVICTGALLTALQSPAVTALGYANFYPQETQAIFGADLGEILVGIDDDGVHASNYYGDFGWLKDGNLTLGFTDKKLCGSWDASGRSITGEGNITVNMPHPFPDLGRIFEVLYIGSALSGGARKLYSTIKRLTVWNKRLPDARMQQLTLS